jgi:uncharacterized protein (DUF1330 family)
MKSANLKAVAGVMLTILLSGCGDDSQTAEIAVRESAPPGFMIIVGNLAPPADVTQGDLERLATYGNEGLAAITAAGAKMEMIAMVPGGGVEVLQGTWPFEGGLALERYNSLEALKTFWFSDLYQAAREHRKGLVDLEANIVLAGIPVGTGLDLKVADPALDVVDGVKSAYMIVAGEILDPDKMTEFMKTGPALAKAAGQEYVAFGSARDLSLLEGAWPWDNVDVTILRFPSLEQARALYADPAWQAAVAARSEAYDIKFVVVAEALGPQTPVIPGAD